MTLPERIDAAQALIARLEGDLAAAQAAQAEYRTIRQRVALSAAEGDEDAIAQLAEASTAAATALLAAENAELALTAARERLAGLEIELQAEEREAQRKLNVERCYQRVALAGRIDALLAEVAPVVTQWAEMGMELYNAKFNGEPGVVGAGDLFMQRNVMKNALPPALANALGLTLWIGDHKPLAQADPAAMTVRHAEGGSTVIAYRDIGAEALASLQKEAEARRSRLHADPHKRLEAEAKGEEPMAGREGLAALADLVVVDALPGGGAVTQNRLYAELPRDEPEPPEPTAPIATGEQPADEPDSTPIPQEAA